MVKKIFSLNASFVVLLTLIGTLFGVTPHGYAQTVQDWTEPINLSKSGAATNPSMVVDSHGILHALWVDKFEGYKYVDSPDGVTWSSPLNVQFPFSTLQTIPPVFLADPKGLIHIFWLSDKNELFYAQALDENLDTPGVWRAIFRLDTSVFDFDINLDAQSKLHLAYIKNPVPAADAGSRLPSVPAEGTAGVFYRRSEDGGNTWAASSLLYESSYFRALTSEKARIRVAVSDTPDGGKVYAVWDEQAQKRIFIASSLDGGSTWSPAKELVTPQASLGFKTPYRADIDVVQDKLLLTWQVGEPGVQCTPYSSVSSNGGESWDEPIKILADLAACPEKGEFLPIDPAYSVVVFTLQGALSISAWDGIQWSHPEIQLGPSSVTNPATFDLVTLGCQQARAKQDQLFVIGCQQDGDGDIWFMSRRLGPLENLFPLPSAWSGDANVTTVTEKITSLSSITDAKNNVHALWVQSSASLTGPANSRIEYSRWNGSEWTRSAPVIKDLAGLPLDLTLQIDNEQRLLLSWIDQETGELLFSWASAERANVPLEWKTPVVISSSSQLIQSPDMLVDASDRIVIAYAITLNEERGVYIIQSTDLGATWSSPVRVFDAVSANWPMVDQPRLTVTEDGRLHILFTQYSLLGSPQAVSLYHSESTDGGFSWTPPELVINKAVEWSEIVAFNQTLHRFWREEDQTILTTQHQVSLDAGITWSSSTSLPRADVIDSEPTVLLDGNGKVHLLQITREDVPILQEWDWTNERPQILATRKLGIPPDDSQIVLQSGITSQGKIYALIQSKKILPTDDIESNILSISRALELPEAALPGSASISTPSAPAFATPDPKLETTPTLVSPLANMEDIPSRETIKNIVGLFLIVSVVILILFLTIPRKNKVTAKVRQSKQ